MTEAFLEIIKDLRADSDPVPVQDLVDRIRAEQNVDATEVSSGNFYSLLGFFTTDHFPHLKRRAVGLLILEILRTLPQTRADLDAAPRNLKTTVGSLILSDARDDLKLISGAIVRLQSLNKLPIDDLWPGSTDQRAAQRFPAEANSQWVEEFENYLDDLHDLLSFATSTLQWALYITINGFPPSRLDKQGRLPVVQDDSTVTICWIDSAQNFHFLDVFLRNVQKASYVQNKLRKRTESQAFADDVKLDLDPPVFLNNSRESEAGEILITFGDMETATDALNDIKEQMGRFKFQVASAEEIALPLSNVQKQTDKDKMKQPYDASGASKKSTKGTLTSARPTVPITISHECHRKEAPIARRSDGDKEGVVQIERKLPPKKSKGSGQLRTQPSVNNVRGHVDPTSEPQPLPSGHGRKDASIATATKPEDDVIETIEDHNSPALTPVGKSSKLQNSGKALSKVKDRMKKAPEDHGHGAAGDFEIPADKATCKKQQKISRGRKKALNSSKTAPKSKRVIRTSKAAKVSSSKQKKNKEDSLDESEASVSVELSEEQSRLAIRKDTTRKERSAASTKSKRSEVAKTTAPNVKPPLRRSKRVLATLANYNEDMGNTSDLENGDTNLREQSEVREDTGGVLKATSQLSTNIEGAPPDDLRTKELLAAPEPNLNQGHSLSCRRSDQAHDVLSTDELQGPEDAPQLPYSLEKPASGAQPMPHQAEATQQEEETAATTERSMSTKTRPENNDEENQIDAPPTPRLTNQCIEMSVDTKDEQIPAPEAQMIISNAQPQIGGKDGHLISAQIAHSIGPEMRPCDDQKDGWADVLTPRRKAQTKNQPCSDEGPGKKCGLVATAQLIDDSTPHLPAESNPAADLDLPIIAEEEADFVNLSAENSESPRNNRESIQGAKRDSTNARRDVMDNTEQSNEDSVAPINDQGDADPTFAQGDHGREQNSSHRSKETVANSSQGNNVATVPVGNPSVVAPGSFVGASDRRLVRNIPFGQGGFDGNNSNHGTSPSPSERTIALLCEPNFRKPHVVNFSIAGPQNQGKQVFKEAKEPSEQPDQLGQNKHVQIPHNVRAQDILTPSTTSNRKRKTPVSKSPEKKRQRTSIMPNATSGGGVLNLDYDQLPDLGVSSSSSGDDIAPAKTNAAFKHQNLNATSEQRGLPSEVAQIKGLSPNAAPVSSKTSHPGCIMEMEEDQKPARLPAVPSQESTQSPVFQPVNSHPEKPAHVPETKSISNKKDLVIQSELQHHLGQKFKHPSRADGSRTFSSIFANTTQQTIQSRHANNSHEDRSNCEPSVPSEQVPDPALSGHSKPLCNIQPIESPLLGHAKYPDARVKSGEHNVRQPPAQTGQERRNEDDVNESDGRKRTQNGTQKYDPQSRMSRFQHRRLTYARPAMNPPAEEWNDEDITLVEPQNHPEADRTVPPVDALNEETHDVNGNDTQVDSSSLSTSRRSLSPTPQSDDSTIHGDEATLWHQRLAPHQQSTLEILTSISRQFLTHLANNEEACGRIIADYSSSGERITEDLADSMQTDAEAAQEGATRLKEEMAKYLSSFRGVIVGWKAEGQERKERIVDGARVESERGEKIRVALEQMRRRFCGSKWSRSGAAEVEDEEMDGGSEGRGEGLFVSQE